MSYLVLHMDKFKRESLRGIQSHNRRERRSHSNPDIRREKTPHIHFLHVPVTPDGRICKNYEELEKRKTDAYEEKRQLKQFVAQPDEKPRFEQFLAEQQEEARRVEMGRQSRLSARRPAPSRDDDGPSFSPR